MEPRPHERGNLQPVVDGARAPGPSMEPRPHERGNQPGRAGQDHGRQAFNGATSSRTWKRCAHGRAHPCAGSFNGATSSRTWKPEGSATSETEAATLQWSHVLTNVE